MTRQLKIRSFIKLKRSYSDSCSLFSYRLIFKAPEKSAPGPGQGFPVAAKILSTIHQCSSGEIFCYKVFDNLAFNLIAYYYAVNESIVKR